MDVEGFDWVWSTLPQMSAYQLFIACVAGYTVGVRNLGFLMFVFVYFDQFTTPNLSLYRRHDGCLPRVCTESTQFPMSHRIRPVGHNFKLILKLVCVYKTMPV